MTDVSISAIIPTKNRPDDLRLTLKTLLSQSIPAAELIIVDQSEDDKSQAITSEMFQQAATKGLSVPELQYIRDTSIKGVSQARNRALDLAKGNLWLFLDDDIDMEPVFIEEMLKVFKENPQVGGIS